MSALKDFFSFGRQVRHGAGLHVSLLRNRSILSRLRRRRPAQGDRRPLVGIFLLEGLGDIVACEPVARYLRARTPNATLVWGVRKDYRELIDANPYVDAVLELHCLSERILLAGSGLLDEVVDLHVSGRSCSLCRTPLQRSSPSAIRLDNYFSFGGLLSSFAQAAGLPPLDDGPRLNIPTETVRSVDHLDLPRRFVTINGTSRDVAKDWPAEKWDSLTAQIEAEEGLPVVEIGLHPCLTSARSSANLCGRLSILQAAEVIRRSVLFIGVDSGPAHMANAVGTPGVIIMGDYLGFASHNPFSGPYRRGERADILHARGPAASLPVDTVLAAVRRRLHLAEPHP